MNLKNNLKLPRITNKNGNAAANAIIAGTTSNQKGRNTIAHPATMKSSGGVQMPILEQKKMSVAKNNVEATLKLPGEGGDQQD